MMNKVFKYPDTHSSKAKIVSLNSKFENLKIGIIGLGGTGSYILDLISKTHVAEIHVYDGDVFQIHNAFRAPGACAPERFSEYLLKVKYYSDIYSKMRFGIIPHPVYVDGTNIHEFKNYDFVFISVDSNKARSFITTALTDFKIPFIDVGLGVNRVGEELFGTVRVTAGIPEQTSHLKHRIGTDEVADNEYGTNIQIVDLNCLNATLAVIQWKKFVGFYQDLKGELNNLYFINTSKLLNEDFTNI